LCTFSYLNGKQEDTAKQKQENTKASNKTRESNEKVRKLN